MTEEQEQTVEAKAEEKAEETVEAKAEEKAEETIEAKAEEKAEEKPKKQKTKAEAEAKVEEKAEEPKKQKAKAEAEAKVEEKAEEPKKQKETEKAAPKPSAAKGGITLTKDELIAAIKNMTVLDLSDLVKALEAEFGVSAAAPVAVAAPAAATQEAAPAEEEEKVEFTITLKDVGANKISVIKTVREVTGLGLKESKDLVESAPTTVKENVGKEETATIKEKLEAVGATIEIK